MRSIILLLVVITSLPVRAQTKAPALDLKGKTPAQVFTEVLPGLGAKDIGARQAPQKQWQAICFHAGAPGNDELRVAVCKLMAGKLGADVPAAARAWLLIQLAFLGRGECVDAVAAALDDADEVVRDAAVRCLANNPTPEATAKLLAKLPAATGKARIALLNALGHRGDKAAVRALTEELAGAEPAAAARALARINTLEATQAVGAARHLAQGPTRLWICDAYLLCADRLLRDGKAGEAATIYRLLYQGGNEPRPVKLAALRGLLRSAGDDAGPLLLEVLRGNDRAAADIAIGQIEAINAGALKTLAVNVDKLPASAHVLLLGALAARGDKSQLPVALAALKNDADSVRRAGLQALGKLGDVTTVPLLVEALFADAKLMGAARESLVALAAPGVDDKIIAALQAEKDVGRGATLMGVLESRRATAAVPVLLAAAEGSNAALRGAAMNALRQLAEPRDVPRLLQGLLKADKGKERDEAERTIVAVAAKGADAESRAAPVLLRLQEGGKDEMPILLPLLGRLGGASALLEVKRHLAASESALQAAAVQALCNWPDESIAPELLQLARDAKQPQQRQQALRSVVRVIALTNTLPGDKANPARLATLKTAMSLAERDEERGVVLDGLPSVKEVETLRYALPYLDDKALGQRACKTVVELAHSKTLREPNKAEFERALDRVIAQCRDASLVDRAKKYKAGF